jgi:ATP-binding cassette, subfamily B (MDR/TAP), member 1
MQFFDIPEHTTGSLVSRLSTEPTSIQDLLSFNVGLICINIVNLVSSCILAIATGWKLGLALVFGALPPLVFCGYLRIRLEFQLDEDTSNRFASSSGLASEAVMAIRTVSSLTLERKMLENFEGVLSGVSQQTIKTVWSRMFWYALSQSISFLAMALGFW